MARAARRVQTQSQPLYDDDSDGGGGSEPSTPKPRRTGTRKRISEAYLPDQDGSFMSDSGGRAAGQKSVEINDDAAEKRRRRKSTRMTVPVDDTNAEAGPSSGGADGQEQAGSSRPKQKLNLPTIAPPVLNKSDNIEYEQWMKIATENKISQQNTWDVMLIDYFHDMTLLRNEGDNSINFQRASCTLDGCIKIWTSRVDSVGTETAKLASNLASGRTGDDEGDDDDASDDPDGDRTEKRRKKNQRAVKTLVTDPAQLKVKKLDLEFSVDPLFRKTCADFDEGGAQGLLMNHLSLGVGQDGNLRVVFDAGDSISKTDEEEVEDEKEDLIDLTQLRNEFIPDLQALESKAICHSLDDFSFTANNAGADDSTFYQDNTHAGPDDDDADDDFGADFDMNGGPETAEDFFTGNDAVNDDFGGNMMGGNDLDGDSPPPNGEAGEGAEGTGPYAPFDPRQVPKRNDLVLAMGDENEGGMMDYFDKAFMKNWAGPEHWKMRKPIKRADGEAGATKEPKKKEKKEAFRIDFLTPRTEEETKAVKEKLFAKPGKGVSINLPGTTTAGTKSKRKTKEKEKRSDHKLPDDMHFSSKQLITLFLKPKFELHSRSRGYGRGGLAPPPPNGEVDENFWAQAAAEREARNAAGENDESGPIPFATQFFDDPYDDGGGFDDVFDNDGFGAPSDDPGEQDLLAASKDMPRRAKPEAVKHAKRAKRVDVRKLKENIWKGLDIVVPKKKEEREDGDRMDIDEVEDDDDDRGEPTAPTDGREFNGVLSNLQTVYPPEKMRDISTSFCFICLLHLANEEGLKLESQEEGSLDDGGGEFAERKVGNIWDLKVYRDPEAAAL
ncbi:hypothetical protein PQX77_011379 [Marasmius sp. AFHP31]|nr:hypothetical protein PQX77_011379 [Marasmius sp. AFHP31]